MGLDLDHISELRWLMTYFNCKHLFGDRVEAERSPMRKGFHISVPGLPYDRGAEYVLRTMLGDDPNRIRFDRETTHKPKRILFQVKWAGNKRYEAEPLNERNILALPFKLNPPKEVFSRV